jgi:hypothetical protein
LSPVIGWQLTHQTMEVNEVVNVKTNNVLD